MNGGPSQSRAGHARRVLFLEALSGLLGCSTGVRGGLPDGRRPDVLRFSFPRKRLFIGDAKETEVPGSAATQSRLFGYIRWFVAHLANPGREGVVVICFGRRADGRRWHDTIKALANEGRVVLTGSGLRQLDSDCSLVWIVAGQRPTHRLLPSTLVLDTLLAL